MLMWKGINIAVLSAGTGQCGLPASWQASLIHHTVCYTNQKCGEYESMYRAMHNRYRSPLMNCDRYDDRWLSWCWYRHECTHVRTSYMYEHRWRARMLLQRVSIPGRLWQWWTGKIETILIDSAYYFEINHLGSMDLQKPNNFKDSLETRFYWGFSQRHSRTCWEKTKCNSSTKGYDNVIETWRSNVPCTLHRLQIPLTNPLPRPRI